MATPVENFDGQIVDEDLLTTDHEGLAPQPAYDFNPDSYDASIPLTPIEQEIAAGPPPQLAQMSSAIANPRNLADIMATMTDNNDPLTEFYKSNPHVGGGAGGNKAPGNTVAQKAVERELRRKGIDPNKYRQEMIKKNQQAQEEAKKSRGPPVPTRTVIVVNVNRSIDLKQLPLDNNILALTNLLKPCHELTSVPCTRLQVGPFAGKSVSVWQDQKAQVLNKRATKLMGGAMRGKIVIAVEGNMTEADFKALESAIKASDEEVI